MSSGRVQVLARAFLPEKQFSASPCLRRKDSKNVLICFGYFVYSPVCRGDDLPQRITCGSCGVVLYSGIELESPTEIMQRYNGICPKCRKRLNFDTETIKIIPVAEK